MEVNTNLIDDIKLPKHCTDSESGQSEIIEPTPAGAPGQETRALTNYAILVWKLGYPHSYLTSNASHNRREVVVSN